MHSHLDIEKKLGESYLCVLGFCNGGRVKVTLMNVGVRYISDGFSSNVCRACGIASTTWFLAEISRFPRTPT